MKYFDWNLFKVCTLNEWGMSDFISPENNLTLSWEIQKLSSLQKLEAFLSWEKNEYENLCSVFTNLSPVCRNFHDADFYYFQACQKVQWWELHHHPLYSKNFPSNLNDISQEDYFKFMNSIALVNTDFTNGKWYNTYIDSYFSQKKSEILSPIGGDLGSSDYIGYYSLSKFTLKGYPKYKKMHDFLLRIIKIDYQNAMQVEMMCNDFYQNCRDTMLTKDLKRAWNVAMELAPGKSLSPKDFISKICNNLLIKENAGKVSCLIYVPSWNFLQKAYLSQIEKFINKPVHFCFFYHDSSVYNGLPKEFKETFSQNQHIILSSFPSGYYKEFLQEGELIILDKWGYVTDNVLVSTNNKMGETINIEKYIDHGLQAEHKEPFQKSSLYYVLIILGSLLPLMLISFLIYRSREKHKQKKSDLARKIKELEIKAIRSQMNPHFIFNALNSIQGLINNQDHKSANIYLSKFAQLMRKVMSNSEKTFVELGEELETVKLYCELEQLRFNIKYAINLANDVEPSKIEIPGMLIQPIVENAIVHGLAPLKGEKLLKITISQQNTSLIIAVSDNGNGIPAPNLDQLREKGFGLKLVEERLQLLNVKKDQISILFTQYGPNEKEPGTTVILTVPIENTV